MDKVVFNPKFVRSKNVRNFEVLMDGLSLSEGEGRFGLVYGRAGRGKSRTCEWYHGHHNTIYLRMMKIWAKSDIEFLAAFARELGLKNPPHRRGICFREVIDRLITDPRPVFLDEIEKLPGEILEICRDITDVTTAPIILVGEEELVSYMTINRRVWSRTFQKLEFLPLETADVMFYAQETTGLTLPPDGAALILATSEGDLRLVKRTMVNLVQIANAKDTRDITLEMIRVAIKTGLGGKQ